MKDEWNGGQSIDQKNQRKYEKTHKEIGLSLFVLIYKNKVEERKRVNYLEPHTEDSCISHEVGGEGERRKTKPKK